jgi:hypothetical protein
MQRLIFSKLFTDRSNKSVRLVFFVLISLIVVELLIGCNNLVKDSQSVNNQKLSGTWEFKNQDGVKNGTAIFDPKNDLDGDVYILSNDLPSGDLALGKTAIAGKYKINKSKNPLELDLTFGDLTTQTIYEIGDDGQLKIANAVPDQPRPTTLDTQPQRLSKVSDNTSITNDIKVLRSPDLVSSSALIREAESKSYIRAILRSQQQIFQEKGQFSTDINQLASGLSLNLEFYNYKITLLDTTSGLLVQHSAIPLKNGLKAYTGIIYAIASSEANQKATKPLLCESNIPTKVIPTSPKKQDEDYICPNNYIRINP